MPRRNLGSRVYGRHSVPLGARWYQDVQRHDTAEIVEHSDPTLNALLTSIPLIRGNNLLYFHCRLVSFLCFVSPCLSWSVGKIRLNPRIVHTFASPCWVMFFSISGDGSTLWFHSSTSFRWLCSSLLVVLHGDDRFYLYGTISTVGPSLGLLYAYLDQL